MAYVRRAWGTDGSLAVSRFTDDQEQFDAGAVVYLHDGRWSRVERSHISGDAVVVKLDAVHTPEQADELRDTVLEMEDSDIPPLPDGEFYHYQVIGCAVHTAHGEDIGTVKEIIATGANDVFVVQAEEGEVLVPAIGGVVETIDVDGRVITVDLPEGLR
ncbi:MAG: ribosome maturation factor RimM [Chloroflexota bacterium]